MVVEVVRVKEFYKTPCKRIVVRAVEARPGELEVKDTYYFRNLSLSLHASRRWSLVCSLSGVHKYLESHTHLSRADPSGGARGP